MDIYQPHQPSRRSCLLARRMSAIGLLCLFVSFSRSGIGQELYVFSEPASSIPAKSLALKYAGMYQRGVMSGNLEHRQSFSAQFGLDRRWMLRTGVTSSNMYQPATRFESANLGIKYRFFSHDEVHRHFRMALFMEGSKSVNKPMFDELSLDGDQSGWQGGLIFTQLLHKLAVSTKLGWLEVIHPRRWDPVHTGKHPYQAFNYAFSAGYLLFPRKYDSFRQTNLNLYLEVLGARNIDRKGGYLDLAPALQLIVHSNTKLNLGYRFQGRGDVFRMSNERWMLSAETTFLHPFKRTRE